MKKALFIILIFFPLNFLLAETDSVQADTSITEKNTPIYLIMGPGIAYGGGNWGKYFKISPAFCLGIEFPFNNEEIFSFELLGHTWFGWNDTKDLHLIASDYVNIGNNWYNQVGISTTLKGYISIIDSVLKMSLNIGGLILSSKRYQAVDTGFAFYYQMNNDLFLKCDIRSLWGLPDMEGHNYNITPNFLFLCINYNIR